jgi:hypothetical protein
LTGLVLGAAAGIALVAMMDPEARRKAKKRAEELSLQAKQAYQKASHQAQQAWQGMEPDIKVAGRRIKEQVQSVRVGDLSPGDRMEELATKGGEVEHQVEDSADNAVDSVTEQYKQVQDLTNH